MVQDTIAAVFALGIFVLVFASMWKAFEKAGVEGWKAIIPIYNLYVVIKLSDITPWIMLGFFVPLVSVVVAFYVYYKFAENFGRSTPICILTGIFPFVGLPIIAFGDAVYEGEFSPE